MKNVSIFKIPNEDNTLLRVGSNEFVGSEIITKEEMLQLFSEVLKEYGYKIVKEG